MSDIWRRFKIQDILEYEAAVNVDGIGLHHVDRIQDNFKMREGSLILKMIPCYWKIDGTG